MQFGDQHLGGTVQLIEHDYQGQSYRSTGYFADIKYLEPNKTKFYPFENNFHEVFEKKTRGLKIIIPFLRKEYSDQTEIIRSVCDSFFVSILLNKLEVDVNGKKIDANNIQEYVNDPEFYNQNIADMKQTFTPLYVNTYLNQPPRTIQVSDGKEDYEFNLYFRYDEEIPKGRVAVVRTIGMKIEDKKVKNKANQPFNAVLIGGMKEDAYLKSLENESHTELTFDHIKDPVLQKRAKRFINNLSKEMTVVIDEAIKKHNPSRWTKWIQKTCCTFLKFNLNKNYRKRWAQLSSIRKNQSSKSMMIYRLKKVKRNLEATPNQPRNRLSNR